MHLPVDKHLLVSVYLGQAKLWRITGDVNNAVDACGQALGLNAYDADINYKLALNLIALKKYDDSISVLKQVLKLRPHHPSALHLINALEEKSVSSAPIEYICDLFDRYATTFDNRMKGVVNYRVPGFIKKRLKNFTKQRGIFSRCIDLGCGTGLMGLALKPFTQHITGVDISRKMLRHAYQKKVYDSIVCDEIS